MEFTFDGSGDIATLYGRVDLSDYVSVLNSNGLAIKEVRWQLRNPSQADTGMLNPVLATPLAIEVNQFSGIKIWGCTVAYQSAVDVGIGSPNVIALEERHSNISPIQDAGSNVGGSTSFGREWYGTLDLHPEGYTVVTDMLIGIAANNCTALAGDTLQLDIQIIAEPVSITKGRLEEMLAQGSDL
ncbi:unnamed protein product [marine sediment metagenome]|uniref:Uncharacterized protein n=1 Tax=marine sediment metagenome TaxID=412755 RepID=X1D565_9ZZZZ